MSRDSADYAAELWSALVTDLETVVTDELVRTWSAVDDLSAYRAEWRRAIEGWVAVAGKLLGRWIADRSESEAALEMLHGLPPFVSNAPLPDLFRLLASFSLFRLRPYLRGLVWHQHRNKLIPEVFIRDVVRDQTSDLSAGETAFAAFASDDGAYASGMVVADAFSNLRGTFSLIDRVLGLRSNAFIPLRTKHDRDTSGELLGMVVVSLPLPRMFSRDVTRVLSRSAQKYSELLYLLLRMEQGEERGKIEERLLSSDSLAVEGLCRDLVGRSDRRLRQGALDGEVKVPACVLVRCVSESSAEVMLRSAEGFIERECECKYLEIESELSCYGIPDREASVPNSQDATAGQLYLISDGSVISNLPEQVERLLRQVSDVVTNATEFLHTKDSSEVVRGHVCIELLKDASRHLMDFATSVGDVESERGRFLSLFRLLGSELDSAEVSESLDAFRRWIRTNLRSCHILTLAVGRCCPVVTLRAGESYLSLVEELSAQRAESTATLPEHVSLELGRTHGFLSWVRSMGQMISTVPVGTSVTLSSRRGFELVRGGEPYCVLTSFLLPEDSALTIRREGDSVHTVLSIQGRDLSTKWGWRPSFFPLSVRPLRRVSYRLQLSETVKGLWPDTGELFCELLRFHGQTNGWPGPVHGDKSMPVERHALEAVKAIAEKLPWFGRVVNTVAIIPLLPIREKRALALRSWAARTGSKHLLVIGCLERPRAAALQHLQAGTELRSSPRLLLRCFDARKHPDPLVRRFSFISSILHNLADERTLRQADLYKRKQLGRLLHDFQGYINALDAVLQADTPAMSTAAATVVRAYRQLQQYSMVGQITPATFDELKAHLNEGATQGIGRAVRRQGEDNRRRMSSMLVGLDGLPSADQRRPEIEELFSNIFANALEAALPGEGQVVVKTRRPWITITNPCEPDKWTSFCRNLRAPIRPRVWHGTDEIKVLVSLLDLKVRTAKTHARGQHFAVLSVGAKEVS